MICPKCGVITKNGGEYCAICGAKMSDPPAAPAEINSAFSAPGNLGGSAPAPRPVEYVPKHASPGPVRPAAEPQMSVWDTVQRTPAAPVRPVPVPEPVPAHTPAAPTAPYGAQVRDANRCAGCGNPVVAGSAFCGSCGYRFGMPRDPGAKKTYGTPAKNTKLWVVFAAAAALILVVAAVILVLTLSGNPLVKIGSAVKKTVNAGNFTATYSVDVDGYETEGELFADIDVKNRTVTMYTVIEDGGATMTIGIYDEYVFTYYEYGGYSYGYAEDIGSELDDIFDAYEEAGGSDPGELLDRLDELMEDYTGDALSEYMDLAALEKCIKTYARAASKEKWLKSNAGYSRSKVAGETLYTFKPELYDFLMASLPYFESAFEDSDDYEILMEALEDGEDYLDDGMDMEYTIGVRSGYLSSVCFTVEIDGEEVEVTVDIYNVNKTTIDISELEDMLDAARKSG